MRQVQVSAAHPPLTLTLNRCDKFKSPLLTHLKLVALWYAAGDALAPMPSLPELTLAQRMRASEHARKRRAAHHSRRAQNAALAGRTEPLNAHAANLMATVEQDELDRKLRQRRAHRQGREQQTSQGHSSAAAPVQNRRLFQSVDYTRTLDKGGQADEVKPYNFFDIWTDARVRKHRKVAAKWGPKFAEQWMDGVTDQMGLAQYNKGALDWTPNAASYVGTKDDCVFAVGWNIPEAVAVTFDNSRSRCYYFKEFDPRDKGIKSVRQCIVCLCLNHKPMHNASEADDDLPLGVGHALYV